MWEQNLLITPEQQQRRRTHHNFALHLVELLTHGEFRNSTEISQLRKAPQTHNSIFISPLTAQPAFAAWNAASCRSRSDSFQRTFHQYARLLIPSTSDPSCSPGLCACSSSVPALFLHGYQWVLLATPTVRIWNTDGSFTLATFWSVGFDRSKKLLLIILK